MTNLKSVLHYAMRYFQHKDGLFPNLTEEAKASYKKLGFPITPYILSFDGKTFFEIDENGEKRSGFQDVELCQEWVAEGIWVEIFANPFEKTA